MLSEKEREKEQKKELKEFARFLDKVNPSDFGKATGSDENELLATSTNPADWRHVLDGINAVLSPGGDSREALMKVLPSAIYLATNDDLDPEACEVLMRLFAGKGFVQLGLNLVLNQSLSEQHYRWLARMGNRDMRKNLASNPVVGPTVLEILITEETDDAVVLEALDNRCCSWALQQMAKPALVHAHSVTKAMAVVAIRKARTAEDFEKCFKYSPQFDARLDEAYANNPYTPEALIDAIAKTDSIAGEIATVNLADLYYRFQQRK